jgi:hypothetical protein
MILLIINQFMKNKFYLNAGLGMLAAALDALIFGAIAMSIYFTR